MLGYRKITNEGLKELAPLRGLSNLHFHNTAIGDAGLKVLAALENLTYLPKRLRAALSELVPADELGNWMRTLIPAIEGQTPIPVIERGEADCIWRMVFQIDARVTN